MPVDNNLYQLLLKTLIIYKSIYTTEEIPNTIDDKKIEVLIIASIKTLKRQKSKCAKDELFKFVKDMIEENITRNIFDKALESLIESGSVKCSLISNRTCLSLRKHNAIENSDLQGNFSNFKKDLIEDCDKLKTAFFAEIKSFKDKVLDSFDNVVDSPTDGSKTFTAHILEEVYFLRKQLKSIDEMISSLLNQLAKCNDMLELQKAITHHHHRRHHFLHQRQHYHHLYHSHHHHRCCHHRYHHHHRHPHHHYHHHHHHHHHHHQIQIFYQHQKQ